MVHFHLHYCLQYIFCLIPLLLAAYLLWMNFVSFLSNLHFPCNLFVLQQSISQSWVEWCHLRSVLSFMLLFLYLSSDPVLINLLRSAFIKKLMPFILLHCCVIFSFQTPADPFMFNSCIFSRVGEFELNKTWSSCYLLLPPPILHKVIWLLAFCSSWLILIPASPVSIHLSTLQRYLVWCKAAFRSCPFVHSFSKCSSFFHIYC